MAWQKRHTIWIKIISIVIVCLFTINNISSANPDLFTSKNNTCLQVQSAFNPIVSQTITHEMMLKFYTKGIVESLEKQEDFKLRLTLPALDGQFIVLDFENKEYDEKAEKWIIPCSVVDKAGGPVNKYNAVVDAKNKSVSLEKVEEKRFRLRFPKKNPDDPEIDIEIRGFDKYLAKRFITYIKFIFSDATILRRLRSSGKLYDYDLENLKRIVLYNPDDEAHKALGGKVGLLKKKDALWLPVKDVNNVYMEIARSLWKVIRPQPLRSKIIEWDEETRKLLEEHDPGIFKRIQQCLSWDRQNMDPDHLFAARSMWLKLKEPITVNNVTFRYVKLKGTTYHGIFPPSSEEFKDGPTKTWVADDEGKIEFVEAKHILGAMSKDGAKNEFDIMKPALEDDISRALRLARGVYPDIQLGEEKGHFVAMLVPEAPEITLEQLLFEDLPEVKEEADRLKAAERSGGPDESISENIPEVIERVRNFALNHGVQVRRANDKGYFLKWPHQNNCLLIEGEQGPEQRMKDFETSKRVDRISNPKKMIACRFIGVFQAIRHYKDFFVKHASFKMLLERTGVDPIRVFLEGYFHDRKDDPRIEVLYKALSAADPYRPSMSRPVAEADHPAVK
ncbi:MAG: hypothetical protein WBC99_05110, partial [Candidatus Omnitrophota bacterium]